MQNKEKKQVIENFSRNASYYVTSAIHAEGDDLNTLVEWLQPDKSWITLDIATGAGHVAKALSPHVNQVIASDLTKAMLNAAAGYLQDYHNILYTIGDSENLPFLDEAFDAVTCRIAAHHFPHPERFIKEVNRVLKPNGKFILIDNISPEETLLAEFMNTFEKLRDSSHIKALSVSEWKGLLHKYQMDVAKIRTRKKKFVFEKWISRTTDTEEQRSIVRNFLLNGSPQSHEYFHVVKNGEEIMSLEIDEMMLLGIKQLTGSQS